MAVRSVCVHDLNRDVWYNLEVSQLRDDPFEADVWDKLNRIQCHTNSMSKAAAIVSCVFSIIAGVCFIPTKNSAGQEDPARGPGIILAGVAAVLCCVSCCSYESLGKKKAALAQSVEKLFQEKLKQNQLSTNFEQIHPPRKPDFQVDIYPLNALPVRIEVDDDKRDGQEGAVDYFSLNEEAQSDGGDV